MLILDTDIASAFAKAGHFDVLVNLSGNLGITPMVYQELQAPLKHGYAYPEEIFKKTKLVTVSEEEQKDYLKLKEKYANIGNGELESIVVCKRRKLLFSSFDKKAISVAKEFGVAVITGGAIFKGLVKKRIALKEEVLKIIFDIEESDNRSIEITI